MRGLPKANAGVFCRECKDKKPGCHTDCFAYKVAKADYDAKKEARLKAIQEEKLQDDYVITKFEKMKRR